MDALQASTLARPGRGHGILGRAKELKTAIRDSATVLPLRPGRRPRCGCRRLQ